MPEITLKQWPIQVKLSSQDLAELRQLATNTAGPAVKEKWLKLVTDWMK